MKSNEDIEEAVVTVHKMTEDEKMRRIADLREKNKTQRLSRWTKCRI